MNENIKEIIKEKGITLTRLVFVDLGGVLRGRAWSTTFIDNALEMGAKCMGAILPPLDTLYPGSRFDCSAQDIFIVPDPDTFSVLPYSPKTARFICDLYTSSRKPWEFCTRDVLRRVLAEAREMGFRFFAANETEFYVVKKEGGKIVPFDLEVQGAAKASSSYGFDLSEQLIQDYVDTLRKMNIEVTRVINEGGPGQFEVNIMHQEGLKAADDFITYKEAIKAVSFRHGYIATFLPRPFNEYFGSGVHLHQSLMDSSGRRNLFVDVNDERGLGLSQTCYYYMGGILEHTMALCGIVAPTVNSYKRLLPRTVSVDGVAYGPENRTAAIRIPVERTELGVESTRIEYRVPDATCNPYLALATILAAGLDGIKKKIEPGDPVTFDMGNVTEAELKRRGIKRLPKTLYEAIEELKNDDLIRSVLGEAMFEEYIKMKEFEWDQYRKYVTPWEINNFLDVY